MAFMENCQRCDAIFDTRQADAGCDGCDGYWCGECDVERFYFAGMPRCTLCWRDKPDPVRKEHLLQLALRKLDVTESALRAEFLRTAPRRFLEARDAWRCTQCPEGHCASDECAEVGRDYWMPAAAAAADDDDLEDYRGYCCRAQTGRAPHEHCDGCIDWQNRRVARTLVGLRRHRRRSLWAQLPRDVLVHAVIKPHILNARPAAPPPPPKRQKRDES